jgi:hypothetical protein
MEKMLLNNFIFVSYLYGNELKNIPAELFRGLDNLKEM